MTDAHVTHPRSAGVVLPQYWIDRLPGEAAPGAWIGVDFDGTLAEYHGWQGVAHVGAPIGPMVDRVRAALQRGWPIRIVTARVCSEQEDEDRQTARQLIRQWCVNHLGTALPVVASKDFRMIELWDDRCVQVQSNTGQPTVERALQIQAMGYEALLTLERGERGERDARAAGKETSGDGDDTYRPVGFPG